MNALDGILHGKQLTVWSVHVYFLTLSAVLKVNDWQEIGKKKKTQVGGKAGQPAVTSGGSGEASNDGVNDRNDAVNDTDRIQDRHSDSAPRGRRERGGGPRFSRGALCSCYLMSIYLYTMLLIYLLLLYCWLVHYMVTLSV